MDYNVPLFRYISRREERANRPRPCGRRAGSCNPIFGGVSSLAFHTITHYTCNSWLSSEWKPAWPGGPGGTGTSSVIFRNIFVIAKWYLQKPSSHNKFLLLLLWSSSSRTQGIERKTRKIRRNKTSVVKRNLHHRFYMLLDYSHLNTSVVFISYISYKILVPV